MLYKTPKKQIFIICLMGVLYLYYLTKFYKQEYTTFLSLGW